MNTTTSQNEILSTLPSLAVVVFIFLSSWFKRTFGAKRVVAAGLLIVGLSGIVPMFTTYYPVIFISRLVLGCGLGLYNSLAVDIINSLYGGDTRATLLGFRSSAESIGQAVLLIIAGLLLNLGWHWTFAVYLFALPVLAYFWICVPDISQDATGDDQAEQGPDERPAGGNGKGEHLNPFVYVLALFAAVQVLNSLAITVRFPSIAVSMRGQGFNSSFLLSGLPILGIISGLLFGVLNKHLGKYVLYLGLAIYAIADALVGLSGENFVVATIGLFLSGFPGSLCFPYIFNTLPNITSQHTSAFATSLIFVGCNVGNFVAPLVLQGIQLVFRTNSMVLPFNVLAVVFLLILIAVIIHDVRLAARHVTVK
ncbi:MAG: MFS transporter [Bifidobacterium sp.]|nr:MFS transporter [Bifidobacterium sp.]